jgi:hypothetical protein
MHGSTAYHDKLASSRIDCVLLIERCRRITVSDRHIEEQNVVKTVNYVNYEVM